MSFVRLKSRLAGGRNQFKLDRINSRFEIVAISLLVLFGLVYIFWPNQPPSYALGPAGALLEPTNPIMASRLHLDKASKTFNFNQNYTYNPSNLLGLAGSEVKASAGENASQGITVTDSVHKVSFTMTPEFSLDKGQRSANRIVYPLTGSSTGWLVETMHAIGVKEDILLTGGGSNSATFDYHLSLGSNLSAKMEQNGSVGIYGNTLFAGQISTSDAKDAALLAKARKNAPKNTLLFEIPAPIIAALNKKPSKAKASFSLDGSTLKLHISNLLQASYPLTVDPSIFVSTAQEFMNGNDETNIAFDVADHLIEKGPTTGARFNSWTPTMKLNNDIWQQGAAEAGGFVYTVGGNYPNGSTTIFNTQGASNYTVPAGITSITVNAWGSGGGGGGSSTSNNGGSGGGGGYVGTTLTVTPGEVLKVYVAGSGIGGAASNYSGGSGGGYSSVYNGTTPLVVAAGGGGGGGGSTNARFGGGSAGGAGGAGGGTSGVSGSPDSGGNTSGGGGGTATGGGAGGNGGANFGANGSSLQGGGGADSNGTTGGGSTGGSNGGGNSGTGAGGSRFRASTGGGGGGGGGYYGGGGGDSNGSSGAAGAGGGSSYATGSNITNTAGNGTAPGNASDGQLNGAATGGTGGSGGGNGANGTNGLVIISAGSGATNTSSISWAQFNALNGTIQSANPGSGTCAGWCTTPLYNLPAPRSALSLVAYNGYLYAIGGEDASCTDANNTGDGGICDTVYIAKLGPNGEPRLWSPVSTNQSTWTYWYQDTNLTAPLAMTAAVAYQNRMYLIGGETSASGTASVTNTVQIANISPTGTLDTWASSTPLPYNLYGHGVQIYNENIYIIGGASSIGGAPINSVYYNKINADGTLNGWTQTSSFNTGRMTDGGNFTTIWDGYIYLAGGCTAMNASGDCTAVASDTQIASINADGSLDQWLTNSSVSDARMGDNLLAWNNYIYEIGGCTQQNATNGSCTSALNTIDYGTINSEGDISSVTQSVASGTAPCSGANPYNCNLPTAGGVGQMLNATAVINGYVYLAGGCTNTFCSNVSGDTGYAVISSDGALTAPSNCATDGNTLYGAWCVDSTHTINFGNHGFGRTGVAGAATAVFDNTIYFIGGIEGSGLTDEIYYVSTNPDGSLNSNGWQYETLDTTAGATSVAYEYAYARANPSSAGTNPGNLYIFGGCSAMFFGTDCSNYTNAVYKCNIATNGSVNGCSTTGQLQFGTASGASGTGLGGMGGTVYANYVYLIGGTAPGVNALSTVYYATINNSNNVVPISGNSGWALESNGLSAPSQYSVGFGYNGYIYAIGGYNGSSVLGTVEFAKINTSDGSISAFTISGSAIMTSWGMGLAVSNSYAFILGGCSAGAPPFNCSNLENSVQSFQIYNNDSGAPAGYATVANTYSTDPNRLGASATILNGYLYVAGGCTSSTDCTQTVNDVSYAPISATGAVGSWASASATLPASLAYGKLEAAGGSLYYIGGQTAGGAAVSTVYYTTPSSGNVTSWGTANNGLPTALTKFGAAVWNNRLYVTGGSNGSSVVASVYVSPQLNSGGNITSAWSTGSTSFNVGRSGLTAIAYANNLYVLGGYTGSSYLSDVQYAQISTSNGNVGGWTYTTSLPEPISQASGFAANGYIYLIGGRSAATTCTPSTLAAPVSANTTIASGNTPTGIGQWYQTSNTYTGARYGNAAVYSNGKAYVIGGACGSTLTYASPAIEQTSILSEPQVAQYSIMFDTGSDVYPQKWLLNGIDNSTGAHWQLSYESMTNTTTLCTSPAMTYWGEITNFGNVTLGTPEPYVPLNASGTDTNCARFYYLAISVDDSEAYGFPDDVSRGPTIDNITLEFTADPAKRLMHGRTFTGEIQQPDATPF